MQKKVKIGGKKVRLKSNALLPVIYQSNFGKDIFEVQSSIFGLVNQDGSISPEGMKQMNCVGIMQVIWCMAKAADKKTPPFEDWLETFDEFPIFDVFGEISELFMSNLTSQTKIKNAEAAED